jgi:PAS domain S-box-containing protein
VAPKEKDDMSPNEAKKKKEGLASVLDLSDGMLRESELLRSVIDGYPIPAFVIGRDHKVIYWNRALEELSGIKAENVIGTRQHWRAFYESKRPCMADLLVAEAKEGIEKWYEGKCRKSNLIDDAYEATDFFPYLGEKGRWLRFTASALRDSTGEPIGAIETLEDITERKVAEEALRDSEQKLYSLIEGSPIPAFVIGIDHRVLFWNRALEELSGIRASDMVDKNEHWRAFYAHERPCMADLLVDGAQDRIPQWYEGKFVKSRLIGDAYEATDFFPALGKDGRWLRFTAALIRNLQGNTIGALETLEDVTDRKRAEEALQKAYDGLEVRVQERTRELSESSRALQAEVMERQQKEKELKDREKELKIKSERLEEMNTALKVLLEQRDQDRKELEENILGNVKELIQPYIENLRKTPLNESQLSHLEVVESNLNNIISPFLRSLKSKYLNLTPRETQVATLIKEGRTSKDISELLNMSLPAVEFHRSNIRKKVGLRNKKANLRSHLSSFL